MLVCYMILQNASVDVTALVDVTISTLFSLLSEEECSQTEFLGGAGLMIDPAASIQPEGSAFFRHE